MTAFCETILKEISKRLDVHIDVIYMATGRLFFDFEREKYDGIVSMLLPQFTRVGGGSYVISTPLYRLGPVLIVNKKNTFKNLSEMAGKIVALVGDARVEINIEEYPGIIFTGYGNISQAFADLNNQKIDGVIVDSIQGKNYAHGLYSNKFIISDFTLTHQGIMLILHKTKETEYFIEQFNQQMKQLRESGQYAKLLADWHIIDE